MKPLKPEKPKPDATRPMLFNTWQERDAYIMAHADMWVVGRRVGPRAGYERHEVKSLESAKKLGRRMANETGKVYMIYAVAGVHDCFVEAVHPEGGRNA